jgi:PAS domain S-box-containing protein
MFDHDPDNADELRRKLRQVEHRYRTIVDRYKQATTAARVGVWDWNLLTNEFYIDPSLKAILGYTDKEIPNQLESWMSLLHPDDKGPLETATRALLRGEGPDNTFEHRMQHKDGRSHWFIVKGSVEVDAGGSPVRLLGTNTEITQRKKLEMGIQEAISEEHARISLNLHDGLGQELAGISFLLQSLENRLKSHQSPLAADAAEIRKSVSDAIAHTRELARGLYPVPVGPVGIISALRKLADGASRVFKVDCDVVGCQGIQPELQPNQSNQIYFIAQEAVNNAIHHGLAKRIRISCEVQDNEFRMTISDDGTGPNEDDSSREGMGLRIMVYRARNLGGDLSVQAQQAGGMTVSCRIPLKVEKDILS